MALEKALVVENDPILRSALVDGLKAKKIEVSLAESGGKALEMLRQESFDLIFTETKTSDLSGIDLLQNAKQKNPEIIVILTTSYSTVEAAVEAMQLGAFNYLIKPFSQDTLRAMIEKAQEHASLLEENHFLRQEISTHHGIKEQLIAESDLMKKILSDVEKIAQSNASVFISGESGTGKEVIAHAIHFQSQRAHQPFIKVNCAAIPAPLLESEFFGHEKGAFTGAIHKRLGRFELADKGTLLLDEISEIPLELQPKLLRAVQEMEFERVGGIRPLCVDVRLISTSNRCMKDTIEQKLFREDLYYRLNVVPIHLPPLRERPEDILPLAQYFLERMCLENHKNRKQLSALARQKLLAYHWPGNIRELANVIERTIVMTPSDTIHPDHIGLDLSKPTTPIALETPYSVGITLAEMEKRLILQTLASHNNNRTRAAQTLGISIRTLRNKLNLYSR
ncbi:MAG: sigma-54 dependent transcriptional regulator [Rhabdochlamydiaceae bacterium]|nr:sigma-54 dependent transcriptional regulator [Rhabdochlamydiaceae bacterium]